MKKTVWLQADRGLHGTSRWLAYLAGILAYVVAVAVVIDVLLRFITGEPIQGLFEIVTLAIVFLFYYGFPQTILTERHLRLDIILRRFGNRSRAVIEAIHDLLAIVTFTGIGIYVVKQAFDAIVSKAFFGFVIQVPFVYHWVPLGIVLLLSALVSVSSLNKNRKKFLGTSALDKSEKEKGTDEVEDSYISFESQG
jgi:TRAP-type C4-dicarboxylate transport system permease small subunit